MKRRAPAAESDAELDRWGTAESAPGERCAIYDARGTLRNAHSERSITIAESAFSRPPRSWPQPLPLQRTPRRRPRGHSTAAPERRSLPLEAIREVLPELMDLNREGTMAADGWGEARSSRISNGQVRARYRPASSLRLERCSFRARLRRRQRRRHLQVREDRERSFYRYFDSKEAIFLAVAQSTVDAVGDQLDKIPARMNSTRLLKSCRA